MASTAAPGFLLSIVCKVQEEGDQALAGALLPPPWNDDCAGRGGLAG